MKSPLKISPTWWQDIGNNQSNWTILWQNIENEMNEWYIVMTWCHVSSYLSVPLRWVHTAIIGRHVIVTWYWCASCNKVWTHNLLWWPSSKFEICDMMTGNESLDEDFQLWDVWHHFLTYKWYRLIRSGCLVTELWLGLGIPGIFTLETRNIFSGRVPDTRFVNAIQNARVHDTQKWF